MNAAGRILGFAAIGMMLTLCAALGGWWWIDRGVQYEPPRWDEARFESIGATSAATSTDRETWVVAVNPDCPHCMVTLASLADTLAPAPASPRLLALIVDTPRRPANEPVAHPRVDGVYWDRSQVWRKRWGHRLYGEVLRFDADGRFIAARTSITTQTLPGRR